MSYNVSKIWYVRFAKYTDLFTLMDLVIIVSCHFTAVDQLDLGKVFYCNGSSSYLSFRMISDTTTLNKIW